MTRIAVSAERGWIGEPQAPKQWHENRFSRALDRIEWLAVVQARHDELAMLRGSRQRRNSLNGNMTTIAEVSE